MMVSSLSAPKMVVKKRKEKEVDEERERNE